MPRYHLVPYDRDWAVLKEGCRSHACVYGRRVAALRAATRLAREDHGVLVVHDADGHADERLDFRATQAA